MRILNFGSLNIDRTYSLASFVKGGETVSALDYQEFLGGKGLNQSISLKRAGADVYHIGAVGYDGDELIVCLEENNINTTYLEVLDAHSGHAIIQIDAEGENCIIVEGGTNLMVTENHIDKVFADFEDEECLILLQNEISNVAYIIEKAHEAGHRIVLNPSPINEELLKAPLNLVDYFILNETEGNALTGKSNPKEIIEELKRRYPNASAVLTLGSKGSICYEKEEQWEQPAFLSKVIDTTAAGDTFTGHFLSSFTKGEDRQVALEKASIASSLAIGIRGAVNSIPTFEMVEEKLLEVISDDK